MPDLATAIEFALADRAANPATAPEPITIDLANTRPLAKTGVIFHAWMEGYDMWDGWGMYDDLQTALQHAAHDYVAAEYSDQDDPETARPGALVWTKTYGSWHLADGPRSTNVRVTETPVYRVAHPDA